MLNKLTQMLRRYDMVSAGDTVICAVSGGADSVALLWGMYLLRQKLGITLKAAHFNHGLRGDESDRDEDFVRELCDRYQIPLYLGSASVKPGNKGLEAAAREARYAFFAGLPGKIATAHTADDNAETVLLHLVRGTGLRGLGGICPKRQGIIRPMLLCTRQEVLAFLEEYHLTFVHDSSNDTDAFLRNRLRRHVVPLLRQENPRLGENLSAMALKLRQDEQVLEELSRMEGPDVQTLRAMPEALRSRALGRFLEENGVREPEGEHIALMQGLVFSENPSARGHFPGGITVRRQYGTLRVSRQDAPLRTVMLACPGTAEIPGYTVHCEFSTEEGNTPYCFTVRTPGPIVIRHRLEGDRIRLSGGTKTLKKLFIDRKIPADQRLSVAVAADEKGVLGVCGIGADMDRAGPGIRIRFERKRNNQEAL